MAATTASPDIFGQGSGRVRERSEKRVRYVQYRDQKCIMPLWTAGRFVRSALGDSEATAAYHRVVLDINEAYFDARSHEDHIEGRFYKFDEDAERRVRERTAEGYSDAVSDLRELVEIHQSVLDAVDEEEVRSRLFGATSNVLAGGWFPTLSTYYHALDPGEKIAESVTRRKRRIEGEGRHPGVRDLLAGPLFEALNEDDLNEIKGIDWRSPGKPARFVNHLESEFGFIIKRSQW